MRTKKSLKNIESNNINLGEINTKFGTDKNK